MLLCCLTLAHFSSRLHLSILPLLFEWRWVWLGPANAASSILGQKSYRWCGPFQVMLKLELYIANNQNLDSVVGRMWTCTTFWLRKRNGFIVWTCRCLLSISLCCIHLPVVWWCFTLWIPPMPNKWEAETKNPTPEIEDEEMEIGLCFRCDLNATAIWCLYKQH